MGYHLAISGQRSQLSGPAVAKNNNAQNDNDKAKEYAQFPRIQKAAVSNHRPGKQRPGHRHNAVKGFYDAGSFGKRNLGIARKRGRQRRPRQLPGRIKKRT